MKRIPLYMQVIPIYIVVVLAILYSFYSEHQKRIRIQQAVVASEAQFAKPRPVEANPKIVGVPVRVVIPSVNIDLGIVNGQYNSASSAWSVSKAKANYAVNTPLVNNESGKTLIYGHNNKYVFSKILGLKTGDVVYIYADNGHVFKYIYRGARTVEPTDTEVFNQLGGKPGLKLMTCSGAWFQNRSVMYFSLEGAT